MDLSTFFMPRSPTAPNPAPISFGEIKNKTLSTILSLIAEAFNSARLDSVQKPTTEEGHQTTAYGQNFLVTCFISRIRIEEKLSAIILLPSLVKVQDACHQALFTALELIKVFTVVTSWWVGGEMSLELENAQIHGAIDSRA